MVSAMNYVYGVVLGLLALTLVIGGFVGVIRAFVWEPLSNWLREEGYLQL